MPINLPDDLASIDRRMRARIAPWIKRGISLARSKIEDARAHAEKACTDSAIAAREGRMTAAVVKNSRSYLAAVDRLEELTTALAGPRLVTNLGLVRDARAACYRDSFAIWRDLIDPSLWRSRDPQPTREGLANVRAQFVNGMELRDWIANTINGRAGADLLRAVNLASSRSLSARDRFDPLDAWESTKLQIFSQLVMMTMSDSDQRAHTLAAVDVLAIDKIDPEVASILGGRT